MSKPKSVVIDGVIYVPATERTVETSPGGVTFARRKDWADITEVQIIDRLSSLGSASINRIIAAGDAITKARWEDGIFE